MRRYPRFGFSGKNIAIATKKGGSDILSKAVLQLKLEIIAITMIMLQLRLKQLVQEQEKNVAIAIETICTRRKMLQLQR